MLEIETQEAKADLESAPQQETGLDSGRERKYWVAMLLYAALAVIIWFTLGEGTILVLGRRVEIRWIPLFVLGTFVFRTYMAREADKIRRSSGR
jgi:hypothetical protein